MTLLDHADIYGVDGGGSFGDAEALFGEVLRDAPSLRDQMVLATKGGIVLGRPYDSSAYYLESAVNASLTRLGVEVIDLYQIHRPDFLTHPAELADTLEKLRESGKVKEFGVSNYTVSQTRALQAHLSFDLATSQPEWSCWTHAPLRDGTLDLCMERGITPLGWSPLGGGRLGISTEEAQSQAHANPNQDEAQRLFATVSKLDELATRHEVSRAALAIAWTMAHPAGVIPIIGTQRLERMNDCATAVKVQLTREEWNEVLIAAQGYPLP
jgi:predicted oxidoreductase